MANLSKTTAQIDVILGTINVPNQTNFVKSLFIGDGGSHVDNTGTEAGDGNLIVGMGAGEAQTIAKRNTLVGANAGNKITSGWANTFIGYNAGATGVGTGNLDVSGLGGEFYANVGIGEGCMGVATIASYNTGIGTNCLTKLTEGHHNVAVGVHALNENLTGSANTAIGRNALYNCVNNYNTGVGFDAGKAHANENGYIVAIGYQAGTKNNNAGANTYIGYQAGIENVAGYENTFIGHQAGLSSVGKNQYYNTFIGYQAGYSVGNCEGNTFIGDGAGFTKTTGDYNTFIGYYAGRHASQLATAGNSMGIGNGAYTTASNQIVFGNSSVTDTYFGSVSGASNVKCNAITSNGGLQTFGANDSGGVGYRMVVVPNV